MKYNRLVIIWFLTLLWIIPNRGVSQELEPRGLINLPLGTNFIVAGYGYAQGNTLIDPSLPLDNFEGKLHTFGVAYLRSVKLFGLAGKVDAFLPFGTGDWEYEYQGADEFDKVDGFGDLRVRFTLSFLGAPALSLKDYKNYKQETVLGYSVQFIIPTGTYDPAQLPNLGSNRWTIRQQIGLSHTFGQWVMEGYASLWLFMKNDNFLDGNTLEQNPLNGIKVHAVRLLKKGMWLAVDGGYGYGARTIINGEEKDTKISTTRFGFTFAVPISDHHSIKFVGVSGVRLKRGPDFDALGISYQYRWFDKKQRKIKKKCIKVSKV